MKTDKDKLLDTTGIVKEEIPNTRSYIIDTPKGTYRRNRKFRMRTPQHVKEETLELHWDDFTDNDRTASKPLTETACKPPVDVTSPSDHVTITRSGHVVKRPSRFNDYE